MKPVRVENVMKTPVYMIEENKTGTEALSEMQEHGVKKILVVTEDGTPKGVLEAWRIAKMDLGRVIGELDLSVPIYVPTGTEMSEIQQALRESPAVYVHDPKDKKKLLGVITAYDLATLY